MVYLVDRDVYKTTVLSFNFQVDVYSKKVMIKTSQLNLTTPSLI